VKVSMADNVNALAPTRLTIKMEDYPLGRRLFLYQVNQAKPLAAEFIQFALSNEGQNVVSAVGSVSLSLQEKDKIVAERSAIDGQSDKQRLLTDPAIPKAYRELILNADRTDTPLNFRFQPGLFELDNRAFRDIGRLSAKLTEPEFVGSKIILVGFADPKGDAVKNLELSKQRALKIKEQLEAEGLKVDIATGFGEEPALLLDPREDDPASLEKNRRVEVWLSRGRPEVSQR
jgi:phosphate transport system substrate-binding protein